MDYEQIFVHALEKLKHERRYRIFTEIERNAETFPHARWKSADGERDIIMWCSNDYLGMGSHPVVIETLREAARKMGVGAGGTRNISGNSSAIVGLEREIADLHGKEAALVFTSGWISNLAAIGTIAPLNTQLAEVVKQVAAKTDLPADVKSQAEALGKEVVVHSYTDPTMIGGVKFRIGDQLIDASVQTTLRKIRDQLSTQGDAVVRGKINRIIED